MKGWCGREEGWKEGCGGVCVGEGSGGAEKIGG